MCGGSSSIILFRKYEDARIIAANSILYLIISASFYATVVGLIELINPDLLKNDTILFAMFFNIILLIVSSLAAISASFGAVLSYIIKPSKKENKEIETTKS
jgi:hypothetical protein